MMIEFLFLGELSLVEFINYEMISISAIKRLYRRSVLIIQLKSVHY